MTSSSSNFDVTVVIPVFNAAGTLERAVTSIADQIRTPHSVILVIDTSTDDTHKIAKTLLSRDYPFYLKVLTNIENLGPGRSRNIGWDLATTKWVAFLDADDAWDRQKLSLQIPWMDEHPEVDVSATQTVFSAVDPNQNFDAFKTHKVTLNSILFKNPIPTRSVILKREIPNRFRTGLSEDFGLWLELLRSGRKIYKIELPLAIHFRAEYSPGGASSKLFRQERYELFNILRCFSAAPLIVPIAMIFSILKYFRRVLISVARRVKN